MPWDCAVAEMGACPEDMVLELQEGHAKLLARIKSMEEGQVIMQEENKALRAELAKNVEVVQSGVESVKDMKQQQQQIKKQQEEAREDFLENTKVT